MKRWTRLFGLFLVVVGLGMLLWAYWPLARATVHTLLPVVLPLP